MKGTSWIVIVVWAIVLIGMYAIMVLPQRKADKKKKAMVSALNIGDEIITIGGIHGRVAAIREKDITIQFVDDKAKVRIEKWAVREVTRQVEEKAKKIEKIEKIEETEKSETAE